MIDVISDQLGIDSENIEISYDSQNGVLSYSISSDNADSLLEANEQMNDDSFIESLNDEIAEDISVISIETDVTVITICLFLISFLDLGNFWFL